MAAVEEAGLVRVVQLKADAIKVLPFKLETILRGLGLLKFDEGLRGYIHYSCAGTFYFFYCKNTSLFSLFKSGVVSNLLSDLFFSFNAFVDHLVEVVAVEAAKARKGRE